MSCYAWGDVGKPCYESQLRTINRPCKKFSILCYESQLRTINKTCKRSSKPCYESQLRTINKTCKKLKCQITSMQVVKLEGTQVTQDKPLEFRPAWGLGITLLKLVGSPCPIRSNRVLRGPISLDYFHCSSFQFSHWLAIKISQENNPQLSVVSSINRLRSTPK